MGMVPLVGLHPVPAYAQDQQALSQMVDATGAADEDGGNKFGCLGGGPDSLTGCLAWASYTAMSFGAWVAGAMSVILNYAVQDLVVGMGLLVGNLTGITDAWVVLRDIANVFLLFLTIFIGIATILNLSSWNYKQLLWKVVIAALFVNFSLFFTKIVIDVSNLAATELYSLLLQQRPGLGAACLQSITAADFSDSECISDGVAGAFWEQMRLATFYDNTKVAPDVAVDISMRMVWVGLLGFILFLVAAFIFGAAAFLLIGRFVILVLLMILSPIAFVAWVTKVSGSGSKWWRTLLSQSFFAPAIFLMWWIALKIMEGLNTRYVLGTGESFSGSAIMTMSGIALLFYFIMVMGFLIASLIIAKNMGAAGATMAMNTGKSWSKSAGFYAGAKAGNMTAGTLSYISRRTVGAAADRAGNSEWLKNKARSSSSVSRFLARGTRNRLEGVAESSMDIRNTPGIAKTAQKYAGAATGKGGYKEWKKKKIEEEEKNDKWLREYDGSSAERGARDADMEAVNERNTRVQQMQVEERLGNTLNELDAHIEELTKEIDTEAAKGDRADVSKLAVLRQKRSVQTRTRDSMRHMSGDVEGRKQITQQLKDPNLTPESRAVLEERLENTTNRIRNSYGLIDPDVNALEVQRNELQTRLNNTADTKENKTVRAELTSQIAALTKSKDTIVQYHEAKSRLERERGTATREELAVMQAAVKQSESELEQMRINHRAAVDAGYAKAWKQKGTERANANLDILSTETYGLPMAEHRRQAAAKIRAAQGKSKNEKTVADFVKMLDEQDKKKAAEDAAAGPETPAGPSTTT